MKEGLNMSEVVKKDENQNENLENVILSKEEKKFIIDTLVNLRNSRTITDDTRSMLMDNLIDRLKMFTGSKPE